MPLVLHKCPPLYWEKMAMLGVQVTEAPAHVPADLVLDYPIKMGGTIDENPFDRIIPDIHKNMPPIFYSLDAYPGGTPAWMVRRPDPKSTPERSRCFNHA